MTVKKPLPPLREEARLCRYMNEAGITPYLSGGVLLALSGGADSVLLLLFLARLARERAFPLAALHVHHHLRGEEADRDAAFCRELCRAWDVPFEEVHVDVAGEARISHRGIEDTARRLRYRTLEEACRAHGFAVFATAHHATDQLETVLHHLLRGGGARALVGMRPVSGRCIRPLLCLTREEILGALEEAGAAYVTDSTNADISYTRNFLRAEILPLLSHVQNRPEDAVRRLSEAMSHDVAYLEEQAGRALDEMPRCDAGVSAEALRALPEALRRRVLTRLYCEAREAEAEDVAIEHIHLTELSRLLMKRTPAFTLAVPNRLYARLDGGWLSFVRAEESGERPSTDTTPLCEGDNLLPGGFTVSLHREGDTVRLSCFSKFHKIDIMTAFSSDIICGTLHVRGRRPGDAYRFRGHRHSIKKLYNEKKIPLSAREAFPLVCDDGGILWMPFYPVRENP